MNFIADLHIHSRFSRATSKALTVPHLAAWAACKGISVLGTGDFTHPQWRAELAQWLVRDEESGFYRLRELPRCADAPAAAARLLGGDAGERDGLPAGGPLFCLQTEISSIYKRGGQVRKVHNLVFVPTLEDAERLSARLALVGNLHSDGRPILGLDSRDLLEMVLETVPGSVLVPAHVWTPWFALFGSRSGFDRIEDCFGDLTDEVFALETGLSSDPAMNRLLSRLDGYALISNSDAHSGANLGREANCFAGRPSYAGMFAALRAAARREPQDSLDCRFQGTLEFYPEEGKYHLDGHRACGVVLEPARSRELGDICPVCGRPLTIGVLHRVLALADRQTAPRLPLEPQASSLVPLTEVLGEILGVGAGSRKVRERYERVLAELGPELAVLCHLPEARVRAWWEPLGEAVARMRSGAVIREPGFDGQYGTVRLFRPGELDTGHGRGRGRVSLPGLPGLLPGFAPAPERGPNEPGHPVKAQDGRPPTATGGAQAAASPDTRFSPEQLAALTAGLDGAEGTNSADCAADADGVTALAPVLVAAGPGAGKTRVLVGRVAELLRRGAAPDQLLVLTFTRRAAGEIRERLSGQTSKQNAPDVLPWCETLHGLAWRLLRESGQAELPALMGEDAAFSLFAALAAPMSRREARAAWDALCLARERGDKPGAGPAAGQASDSACAPALAARYAYRKREAGLMDYADLLDWLGAAAPGLRGRWRHVLVDEVQDLSPVQLAVVRAFLPPDGAGFFGIGDPDQAIYGFRGACGQSEASLRRLWPGLRVLRLGQSFRSSQSVLDMARTLLEGRGQCGPLRAARPLTARLQLFTAPDENSEARWVAARVRDLVGATAHTLLDASARADASGLEASLAPGDIAVLVRLRAQIPPLREALEAAGVPCAAPAEGDFWRDEGCARFLALCAAHLGLPGMAAVFAAGNGAGMDLPLPDTLTPETLTPEALSPDTLPPDMLPPDQMRARLGRPGPGMVPGVPAPGPGAEGGAAWSALCRLWRECGGWRVFFDRLAWLHEAELLTARAERVQIMTLHASKGLEFQAVFLPGLESGLMPLRRCLLFDAGGQTDDAGNADASDDEAARQLEEERRLLYVGLTRASRGLFVSCAASRRLYGRRLRLAPSPFLPLIRSFCRESTLTRHVRRSEERLSLLADAQAAASRPAGGGHGQSRQARTRRGRA